MNNYNPKFTNDDIIENKLAYYVPNHGKKKTFLKVPESFELYACPASCARRLAIRTIRNDRSRDSAFLLISEADVISGRYESHIIDAVEEILSSKRKADQALPKAFVIYFNCIDDFLGTDEYALVKLLEEKFSPISFTVCHINPVADGRGTPRGMIVYDRLYDFLKSPRAKAPSVNFIGNYVSPNKASDLYKVLASLGIEKINEIFNMTSFSQYEEMSSSSLNVVLMVMGLLAGETMKQRFDIPYVFVPPSYKLEQIEESYRLIANALEKPLDEGVYKEDKNKALEEIRKTLSLVGDCPIAVDTYCSRNPFSLGRALKEYGFNVRAIFAAHAKETDKEDMEYIEKNYKDIVIIKGFDFEKIKSLGLGSEIIAIGFDSAYTLKAKHFVDIRHDEGLYGFYGVSSLMEQIRDAYIKTYSWEKE